MSSAAQITEAQLHANRRNAEKSTGPRTNEGKHRARLNGLRHGLTGQTVVMPHEDRQAFDRHTAQILESLQPKTDRERDLVHAIANDQWRLHRAGAIEHNIFALGAQTHPVKIEGADRSANAALTQAQTFLDDAKQLNLLTLYESRINRTLQRNFNELHALQTDRKAAEALGLEEAALLLQLALTEGKHYDPRPDGFGFSNTEIIRHIDRATRLTAARKLAQTTSHPIKKAA
jgi:hypothetical protein